MKQRILFIFILLLFVSLFISTDGISPKCFENYEGYVIGDIILDKLPSNVSCSFADKEPMIIKFSITNSHLIYYNTDGEIQAHKYICYPITEKYFSCEIWVEKPDRFVYW